MIPDPTFKAGIEITFCMAGKFHFNHPLPGVSIIQKGIPLILFHVIGYTGGPRSRGHHILDRNKDPLYYPDPDTFN
jgi:hypothetical protein